MMETAQQSTLSEVDLDRLMEELDAATRRLPEEAIRTAQQHREQVTPRLIQAIERATAAARDGVEEIGNAHFFALFLLAEFEAQKALPAVVEAITLPEELPFDLFGDVITEALPRILAVLAADRTAVLDGLIRNREANEYVRGAAARSYEYLVRDERVSRDDAVSRLRGALREAIDGENSAGATHVVSSLVSFSPRDAQSEIREAFEQGLVDQGFVDLKYAEESITEGDSRTRRELSRLEGTRIQDTVDELRVWYAFAEPSGQKSLEQDADLDERDLYQRPSTTIVSESPRVGRNEPCPCGSGRKYKKCCGAPQ